MPKIYWPTGRQYCNLALEHPYAFGGLIVLYLVSVLYSIGKKEHERG